MRTFCCLLLGVVFTPTAVDIAPAAVPRTSLMVVAHADTPTLTVETLQKIYLGKIVEIDGRSVIPVNLTRGSTVRKDFMEQVLEQNDEKYVAYWTVRRYIGKGIPPKEFSSVEAQLQYIRSTPGALGYIETSADVAPGLKTLRIVP